MLDGSENPKPQNPVQRDLQIALHTLAFGRPAWPLRIENGTLVIKQGFSHYPQAQECHRFFKGDLSLPRSIILLDGSGSLSFDVLNWLGEQGIALARIEWNGDAAVVASGAGFVANADKLRWQYEIQGDEAKRLEFASTLIAAKLRH